MTNQTESTNPIARYSQGYMEEMKSQGEVSNAHDVGISDSIRAVVNDVDDFARGWIGRIRQLIQRSSQLIERESLLAGAIARLDQHKREWKRKIESEEAALLEQSKLLTEAWLSVEADRRQAAQMLRGGAGRTLPRPIAAASPIIPGPVQPSASPLRMSDNNAPVASTANAIAPTQPPLQQPVAGPAPPTCVPAKPVYSEDSEEHGAIDTPAQPSSLNSPINSVANPPVDPTLEGGYSKIEEFKRLQRAARHRRNA